LGVPLVGTITGVCNTTVALSQL